MVSIMDDLSDEIWEEKGENISDDPPEGYHRYNINRRKMSDTEVCSFQYAAQDEEGKPILLSLPGVKGKRDPLQKIANVMLKIEGDHIAGIALDDCIFEKKAV